MNRVWRRFKKRMGRSGLPVHGSTLIEVLISIAVVVLVLVTVVASGTLMTRNRRFSADQALATKYSQEGVEWAKAMRNTMGWQTFYETVAAKGSPTVLLCLPTLSTSPAAFVAVNPGACLSTNVITGTPYLRSIQFVLVSSSEMNIASYVDWTDNTLDHQTQATAVLKEWQ